jgi:serine phosphatase RsbU (regulator of sigma subunit)
MMDSLGNKDFGDLTQLFIVIGECQQQFGDDRLLQFLRNTQFENAQQLIDAITKEVETHRNGAEPNDDLTVMCMRLV